MENTMKSVVERSAASYADCNEPDVVAECKLAALVKLIALDLGYTQRDAEIWANMAQGRLQSMHEDLGDLLDNNNEGVDQ